MITPDKIKALTIKGLVSDDELMETLILKGGNAISLGHNISNRASYDLDFSIIDGDFKKELKEIGTIMETSLADTFKNEGYHLFDFKIQAKPAVSKEGTVDFWGGYAVEFKIISNELYGKNKKDIDSVRRNAIAYLPNNSPKIQIEISKHEFVESPEAHQIDGLTFYVYPLKLIVFEKLRAICQQVPEYSSVIPSFTPRARAKDFYDIYILLEESGISIEDNQNKDILRKVFDAKKVPYDFLRKIRENKEIHEQNFASLRDTVPAIEKENLKDFDFYFNYVVDFFENYLEN